MIPDSAPVWIALILVLGAIVIALIAALFGLDLDLGPRRLVMRARRPEQPAGPACRPIPASARARERKPLVRQPTGRGLAEAKETVERR
jgi:hypothetical protein